MMQNRIHKALLAVLVLSAPLHAVNYYIATNGSDSNSGKSLGAPFATFDKALNKASAGDTIYVRGGTYTQDFIISNQAGASNQITIRNYQSETVTLGLGTYPAVFYITGANGIVIDGFVMNEIHGKPAITVANSQNITLRNCTIDTTSSSNTASAVYIQDSSSVSLGSFTFQDIGDRALLTAGTTTGVSLSDSTLDGVFGSSVVDFSGITNGPVLDNLTISNLATSYAIMLRDVTNSPTISDCTFTNIRCIDTILMTGSSNTAAITGNTFTNIWSIDGSDFNVIGIINSAGGVNIADNEFLTTFQPSTTFSACYAILASGTENIGITGNTISGFSFKKTGGGTVGTGIWLSGAEGDLLQNVTINSTSIQNVGGQSLTANYLGNGTAVNDLVTNRTALILNSTGTTVLRPIFNGVTTFVALELRNCDGVDVYSGSFTGNSGNALLINDSHDLEVIQNTFASNSGNVTLNIYGASSANLTISGNTFVSNYPDPLNSFVVILADSNGTGIYFADNTIYNDTDIRALPDTSGISLSNSALAFSLSNLASVGVSGNNVSNFSFTNPDSGATIGIGFYIAGASTSARTDLSGYSGNISTNSGRRELQFKNVTNLSIDGNNTEDILYDVPVRFENSNNITIANINFTTGTGEPALLFSNCSNVTLDTCAFDDNPDIAVSATNVNTLTIRDCLFRRNHGPITLSISGTKTRNVTLDNNAFVDNMPSPLIGHAVVSVDGIGAGLIITDNTVSNTDVGGALTSGDTAIAFSLTGLTNIVMHDNSVSNYFYTSNGDSRGTAFFISGSADNYLDASNISSNGTSGIGGRSHDFAYVSGMVLDSIVYDSPVRLTNLSDTTITNCAFDSIFDGFEGDPEPALYLEQCENITINNSQFTNNKGFAILVETSTGTLINGNYFNANQAASTIIIRGSSSTDTTISGNTFSDNFPPNLTQLAADVEILSVIQASSVGSGLQILNNNIFNSAVPSSSGSMGRGEYASAILTDHIDNVTISGNQISNYQYRGYVDQTSDFHPNYLMTPAQGGRIGAGITVTADSGQAVEGGLVSGNTIFNCANNGISVGPSNRAVIEDNIVSFCGQFGIQLVSDLNAVDSDITQSRPDPMVGNIIQDNTVFENGRLNGGMSGIGLFYAGTDDGSDGNIIRNNLCYQNRQGTYPNTGWDWFNDGLGIIFDAASNGNIAYNNICLYNDGSGIGSIKSTHNQIIHNTVIGNGYFASADKSEDLFVQPGIVIYPGPEEQGFESGNCVIINNIAYNNRDFQITAIRDNNHIVRGNVVALGDLSLTGGEYPNGIKISGQNSVVSNNSIMVPQFRGYTWQPLAVNFGLNPADPVRSAGISLAQYSSLLRTSIDDDFEGVVRQGSTPGALESIPSGFFAPQSVASGGWWYSDWFGWFYNLQHPWVYHEILGWVYAPGKTMDDDRSMYWLNGSAWIWTSSVDFPFVFNFNTFGWQYTGL